MAASRVAAALLIALAVTPALADDAAKKEAQVHIDKASEHHKSGRYQQALDELTTAYSLDPQPGLLYAIAQVHVKLGRCTLAVTFYQRFVDSHPGDGPTSAAHEAIAACKQTGDTVVGPANPPPPPPDPHANPNPPDPPPLPPAPVVTPTPADRVWYRDAIGDALVGGGVVLGVVGTIVYANAAGKLDDADRATSYQAQQALVDSAHSNRTVSIVVFVGAAGLIGAGIYHYIRHADAVSSTSVGVTPTGGGGLVTFGGAF